jgi:hypothetical protein
VSANTHKEFTLEILMTMAPILDEGVSSLSFRLEKIQQVVPYEYIRELLGFQKGAPELVGVPEGMLDGFWNMLYGSSIPSRLYKQPSDPLAEGIWLSSVHTPDEVIKSEILRPRNTI